MVGIKRFLLKREKNYLKNGKGNRSGEDLKKYEHTKNNAKSTNEQEEGFIVHFQKSDRETIDLHHTQIHRKCTLKIL